MAERPEKLVGVAVVVVVEILLVQPEAPQRIARILRRNADPRLVVDDIRIGATTAPRDPGAPHGLHQWIGCFDQATGPTPRAVLPRAVLVAVPVWLAVADYDESLIRERPAQCRPEVGSTERPPPLLLHRATAVCGAAPHGRPSGRRRPGRRIDPLPNRPRRTRP